MICYDWMNNVYQRDNYCCQVCGIRGGSLNAHHIKNYSSNKYIRIDVNNGITMCVNCHKDFHKMYGRSNNTIIQLKEFKECYEK